MKTVLITGAYRGLGLEVARQLAARDHKIILTARNRTIGQAAALSLPHATFLELDVTDSTSIARAAQQVTELDVLINNAAIKANGDEDILRIPVELVAQTIATNTLGALRVAQAFVPHLRHSRAGRIVNVSSSAGQFSGIDAALPAYRISKAALNAATCTLAAALQPDHIAVNAVCPGWCRTEMGGPNATRSPEEGAADIVWLAADAPQEKTGLFWRDRQVIPW